MTKPTPSNREQAAYIDAKCPRWGFLANGIGVRVPLLGSALLDWNGAWGAVSNSVGVARIGLGRFEVIFEMPDALDRIQIPRAIRPYVDLPWRLTTVPVMLPLVALKAAHEAAFGSNSRHLRRLWLRLMWRVRPEEMTRRFHAWTARRLADEEERAQVKERWAALEVAREADFEAEVERRLALRLAATGA